MKLLANSADGSVRDGLSILDQVISAGDKFIDRDKVLEYIGTAGEDFFIELTDLVAVHNVAEAIVLLDEALADGKDVKQLMKDWTAHYRSLLITKFIKNPEDMLNMSAENIERIREQSHQISLEEINNAIIRLSRTINDARWSTQPRILLELAIVAIATDLIDEGKLAPRKAAPQVVYETVPAAPQEPVSALQKPVPQPLQTEPSAPQKPAAAQNAAPVRDQAATMSRADMDNLWHQIFEEGEGSASSFNLIRSGTILGNVGESQFTVLAKTGFAQRYAEKMRPDLERLMERHVGRRLKMVCRQEAEEVRNDADSEMEALAKMASETLGIHVEIE